MVNYAKVLDNLIGKGFCCGEFVKSARRVIEAEGCFGNSVGKEAMFEFNDAGKVVRSMFKTETKTFKTSLSQSANGREYTKFVKEGNSLTRTTTTVSQGADGSKITTITHSNGKITKVIKDKDGNIRVFEQKAGSDEMVLKEEVTALNRDLIAETPLSEPIPEPILEDTMYDPTYDIAYLNLINCPENGAITGEIEHGLFDSLI